MDKLNKAVLMITHAITLTAIANLISNFILIIVYDISYLPMYIMPILFIIPLIMTSIKLRLISRGPIKIMTKHWTVLISCILSILLFTYTPDDIKEIYNTYGEYIAEFNENFSTEEEVEHNLKLLSLPSKYTFTGNVLVKAVEAEYDAKIKVDGDHLQLYEDIKFINLLKATLDKQCIIVLFYSYVISLVGLGICSLLDDKVIKEIK